MKRRSAVMFFILIILVMMLPSGRMEAARTGKPARPVITKRVTGGTWIKIKWKKVSNVSGYQIQYSTSRKFASRKTKTITVKKPSQTSVKLTGLKRGTRYYIRIRSYRKSGGKKVYSAWAKEKNKKPEPTKHLVGIDAGHQARSNLGLEPIGPGASEMKAKVSSGTYGAASGLYEYQLTLKVAKKLRKELEQRGYEVLMIRTKHDVDISNAERAIMANEAGCEVFIKLHANGTDDPSVSGALTMCPTAWNPYIADLYPQCRRLSETVLSNLTAVTEANKLDIIETDTMSGINWCEEPVTIVEMGFMSNPEEDLRMATPEYQKKLAQGIADGIDEYFD